MLPGEHACRGEGHTLRILGGRYRDGDPCRRGQRGCRSQRWQPVRGTGDSRSRTLLAHGDHKAIALAVPGLNHPLRGAAVADRLADGRETAGHRRIGYVHVRPHVFEQLRLRHQTTAMLHQVGEDLIRLGFELDRHPSTAQLTAVGVEYILAKDVQHSHSSPRSHSDQLAPGHHARFHRAGACAGQTGRL